VRLIRRDTDSRLAWARRDCACVIFNLHAEHTASAQARLAEDFRCLIDLAIARGGSYFLTYHRHARRDQLLACYPQFPDFLRAKRRHDPEERFQSDWYRHCRAMFADLLESVPAGEAPCAVVSIDNTTPALSPPSLAMASPSRRRKCP
jgi:hypothetical protein